MEIVFELPIPDRKLNPNSRAHWRAVLPHKVAAREASEQAAQRFIQKYQESTGSAWNPLPSARVQVNFCFKDNRRRDKDNFGALLKSTWDGFTRGKLWIDDDELTHLPIVFTTGVPVPRMEITVFSEGSSPTGLSHKPTEEGDL